jgi:hypothetical protein
MPPDHWHYVHSLTSSISVSFWWLRGRYEWEASGISR